MPQRLTVCLCLSLFFPAAIMAQDVAGGLAGRILDETGSPLVGVQVSVRGPDLLGQRTTSTRSGGTFLLTDLPPGSYELTLSLIGRRSVTYAGARVVLGSTTALGDLRLETEAIELEAVRVLGERPAIDPRSAALSSVIESNSFEDLPLPRDYREAVVILPQVNESFLGDGIQAGGSTGAENAYHVDGVNVTDPYLANGGTRLPGNFIESVEVRIGGYEAEYGKALGAIVNAVTYTGSNDFEAGVFGYYSGSGLADEPRVGLVDLGAESFSNFDVGARVSGPIVRDRLWFSAAYNPRVETADRVIPGQDVYEDRFTLHSFAGKFTWQAGEATTLEATVFGDPSTHRRVAPLLVPAPPSVEDPEVMLSRWKLGGTTGSLRLEHRISDRVQLGARLSRAGSQYFEGPDGSDTVEALFIDRETNVQSGGYGGVSETKNHRSSAATDLAVELDRHRLKLGLEFEDNEVRNRFESNFIQFFPDDHTPDTLAAYVRFRTLVASRDRFDPHHNYVATVYLQDSWQATSRLVLNAGVRWSRQQLQGDSASQTFPHEWQPRVGAVYQLGSDGLERIFASFGRFYMQVPVHFSVFFYSPYYESTEYYSADPRTGAPPDSIIEFLDPGVYPDYSDLEVENFDEISGGYERGFGGGFLLRARGVYRRLRNAFGFGNDPENGVFYQIGNPGEGLLDFLPKSTREYAALELSLAKGGSGPFAGQLSYVLSRTWGNFPGEFKADQGTFGGVTNISLLDPDQIPNSSGLLPSDRTHVVKFNGAYRVPIGLQFGAYGSVMSGAPLNRFEPLDFTCFLCPVFLVQRGSAGRSPTLWDLNLRVAYDLPVGGALPNSRLLLDLLHVGSPRTAAWLDQWERLPGGAPNPRFGEANTYQDPMTLRLGFEASF